MSQYAKAVAEFNAAFKTWFPETNLDAETRAIMADYAQAKCRGDIAAKLLTPVKDLNTNLNQTTK